jgi:DNA mismatch repair protein MutS2
LRILPPSATDKLGFDALRDATLELCASVMAGEQIAALQPSADQVVVAQRLAHTAELMALLSTADPLPLSELGDPRDALRRARPDGSILDADSILRVLKIALSARRIRQFLTQRAESFPTLAAWADPLIPLRSVEDAILAILTETGVVRDNASPELQHIRKSLQSRRNDLRTSLARIQRQAAKDGILSENEPTIRGGRMVLAVRAEHKRHISGFIHDTSATGQTVYLEPAEVLHINNDVRQLESDEIREIERLLRILTGVIREHRPPLERDTDLLGELDAMRAIARMSNRWNGVVPVLRKDDRIQLINARNPVLLGAQNSQPVPLNLDLRKEERGLIITGPNAGGKSVALKTLGLCVVLAQSGYAIPAADGSGFPVIDLLAVDMGDDQSIENDLSTFSSRLAWIRDVLDSRSDNRQLVLIDEAASGTDPEEGVALYQALMEILLDRGARMVVTTHHGALKVFAHNHPGMVNGSMEFDREHLSPTYRFRKGIPGSSYAFEIAQRIGVPDELTKKARALIGDKRNHLESLLSDLEAASKAAVDRDESLAIQLKAAERLASDYRQKSETLFKERDKIRAKALEEAKSIMMEANRTVERVVEEIRKANASKEAIKKARKELRDGAESGGPTPGPSMGASHAPTDSHPGAELDEPTPGPTQSRGASHAPEGSHPHGEPGMMAVGAWVRLRDTDTVGEVVEISGKNAFVMVNGMKLRAKLDSLDVERRPKDDGRKAKKTGGWKLLDDESGESSQVARPVSHILDLRGKRGEEAVAEVERFLDHGFAAGLQQLEVIHGKGDGILRKRVHEYLLQRKDVAGFRLAPWEQGGPGVTIVSGK